MTEKQDQDFESALAGALEMRDAGKKPAEILAFFPEYQGEFAEIFHMLDIASRARAYVNPSEAILRGILERMVVTDSKKIRSIQQEAGKNGRSAFAGINFFLKFMNMNWKFMAPIGVLAFVAILVAYSRTGTGDVAPYAAGDATGAARVEGVLGDVTSLEAEVAASPGTTATITASTPSVTAVTPVIATGNIDEAVDAIVANALNEASLLDDASVDLALLDLDSQAINDFTQSYGEEQY